jgi:hypothetical protein
MIADPLVKRVPGPFWSVEVRPFLLRAAPFDVTPCLADQSNGIQDDAAQGKMVARQGLPPSCNTA